MSHKLLRSQGKISGAEFRQLSRERRLYPGLYKIHERQYARRPVGFRTRGRGSSRVVFPVGVREDLRFVTRGVSRGVKETRAALAERRLNKERFEEYLRQEGGRAAELRAEEVRQRELLEEIETVDA